MGTEHMSLCPLLIEKSDVVLVKPSIPTPLVSLSLSTIDNDPYTETLTKTIYVYPPNDAVRDSTDPASLLQNALSRALVYYYPLAGQLRRRSDDRKFELSCNDGGGVPFVRANAACTLSSVLDYLEGADVEEAYGLVPEYEAERGCGSGTEGYKPLAVQVTRFGCGGFTIGMALSHSVCDGLGAAQFFRTLADLAAGKSEPTVMPVWDRHLLTLNHCEVDGDSDLKLLSLPLASVATSSHKPTEDMVREIANVSSDDITRLKMMVSDEDTKDKMVSVTTLEVLAAYVWRARCRALKLKPDGTMVFGLVVGIRSVVEPPLPEGYYGNVFVKTYVELSVGELSESPLSRVVKLIKEAKKAALEKRYVQEKMREMERTLKAKGTLTGGGNEGFMLVTDWRQLGLLENVDFGWKETVNVIPLVPLSLGELCIFLQPSRRVPSMKGGVRVMLTLPRAAMANFMQEMDLLSNYETSSSSSSTRRANH